jgi:NifU-like protein involved in Fe-S cluster formation
VASALYSKEILRLATSIPHLGRLSHPQGSSERRSPLCGSRIAVDVVLDADGQILEIGQVVSACALGQASAAVMGQTAIGRTLPDLMTARDALTDWLAGEGEQPSGWPGLDVFTPALAHVARHGAIRLPFEAVAEAVSRAVAPDA